MMGQSEDCVQYYDRDEHFNDLGRVATSRPDYPCEQNHQGIGCFDDLIIPNERTLTTLLFNDRTGRGVDWRLWTNYTHSVVCRCAKEAAKHGFPFFAIQFFAECWAGNASTFVNHESNNCIDSNMKPCEPGQPREECVGESSTNFVYGLLKHPGPPQVVPTRKPIIEKSTCKSTMDIAIAMDTSGSVNDTDFVKGKEFLKRFIASIGQSAKKSRFALLHYDHVVYIDFRFSDDQRYESLAAKINAFNHTRGATVTQRALAQSLKLFKETTGDVSRALLVITDGRSHGGNKYLIDPLKGLKNEEINVIAVGIDEGAYDAKQMGGDKDHWLDVESFDDLNKHLESIKKLVCG